MITRLTDLWEYQAGPLCKLGWLRVNLANEHWSSTRFQLGVELQGYTGAWFVLIYLGWWHLEVRIDLA